MDTPFSRIQHLREFEIVSGTGEPTPSKGELMQRHRKARTAVFLYPGACTVLHAIPGIPVPFPAYPEDN
jgi:hypothetical protein